MSILKNEKWFKPKNKNAKEEWFCAYCNENLEFDENRLTKKKFARINDLPIDDSVIKLIYIFIKSYKLIY